MNYRDQRMPGANFATQNLCDADFTRALLTSADFQSAILVGANFNLARLTEADFSNADLSGAELQWANLQFAKLHGAILTPETNICYSIGDGRFIKNLHPATPEGWWISYTSSQMSIGCNQHSLERWREMDDEDIRVMAPWAKRLWKVNKDPIFAAIEAFPAEEHA